MDRIATAHYVRRLEQVNEDLRRRNGELLTKLVELGEADYLTPADGYPTRYHFLDRMVTLAAQISDTADTQSYPKDALVDQDLIESLSEAVDRHRYYWEYVEIERQDRAAIAKQRALNRTNKTNLSI